jgi:hypothetical protein
MGDLEGRGADAGTPRRSICEGCGEVVSTRLVPAYISDFSLNEILSPESCPKCGGLASWGGPWPQTWRCTNPMPSPEPIRRIGERGCLVFMLLYLFFPFLLALLVVLVRHVKPG